MDDHTNLEQLARSRRAVRTGDVFALRILGRILHGRVVSTQAAAGFPKPAILGYVYDHQATAVDEPALAELRPDRLLIAPFFINRLPWSRGYFQTVDHVPLGEGDVLAQHCFYRPADGLHYDEHGAVLAVRSEPCGIRALSSYRSVDDKISARLGLPLAQL